MMLAAAVHNPFESPWNDQIRDGCKEMLTRSARLGRSARPRTLPAPPSPAAEGEVSAICIKEDQQ